jgi:hypothetical protein
MNVGVSFEAIIPPEFNVGVIRLYLLTEARWIQSQVYKDFISTVVTWSKKPKFEKVSVSFAKSVVSIEVKTTDPIYGILNWGSRSREGTPGNKVFALSKTFSPKTIPGVIGAVTGIESGTILVRAGSIPHPGVKARKFDETIKKKWDPIIADRFQEAFDQAARKSNHSL